MNKLLFFKLQQNLSKLRCNPDIRNRKKVHKWNLNATSLERQKHVISGGQRNSSLVLDPVKVEDFGNYKCEVKYDDGDSEKCVTSLPAELDVIPSDGMSECQLFANYHLFWVLHVLLI